MALTNEEKKEKSRYIIKTRKWNPYCIRHSAITYDSGYIPEYALKMRWPMNSKQGNIITKEISPLQKVSDHNYF
jgi:integrase/recombinase XerD